MELNFQPSMLNLMTVISYSMNAIKTHSVTKLRVLDQFYSMEILKHVALITTKLSLQQFKIALNSEILTTASSLKIGMELNKQDASENDRFITLILIYTIKLILKVKL